MKNKPIHPINVPGNVQVGLGMTLREHYAGLALQALIANPNSNPDNEGWSWRSGTLEGDAVMYADTLIAQLEGSQS